MGGPASPSQGGPRDDPHDKIMEALKRIEDKLTAIAAKSRSLGKDLDSKAFQVAKIFFFSDEMHVLKSQGVNANPPPGCLVYTMASPPKLLADGRLGFKFGNGRV